MGPENPVNRGIAYFLDDDQAFLEALSFVVEHPHYEIKTQVVNNGYHTIDDIIKTKPSIVFIDFNLPNVNGGQIIPILKAIQDFSRLPIYIVTGYPKDMIETFLKGLEYSGLITKDEHFTAEVIRVLNDEQPA